MITRTFTSTFETMARTLCPGELGINESGWLIEGEVHEDWYEWVNYFTAVHPIYGMIEGDFEDVVTAASDEALDHFMKHHEPQEWDYWDI